MANPTNPSTQAFEENAGESRFESHIFLLAGAPAVGKSSTARALAARFQKSIHIPVDDLRDMVISGLSLPGNWDDKLIEQLTLARESAAHMGIKYSRAGFTVVMDDFWDPVSLLQEYHELFQLPNLHKILLAPSEQAAQARNLKRAGPGDASQYIAGGIQIVYMHLQAELSKLERQGWMVVDSTDKSIDATVNHILQQAGELAGSEAVNG